MSAVYRKHENILENKPTHSAHRHPKKSEDACADDFDPLSVYLKQISQYPLLSSQEEIELGKRIQKAKHALAALDTLRKNDNIKEEDYLQQYEQYKNELCACKKQMITSNLRLVVSIAKNYQNRGLPLLDIIDEGNIGLIEAVERFDYQRGCRFSTYGTWWIRQAIIKSLADKGRVIRIPVHMLNTIKHCYYMAKQLTQELGRDPNPEELAERLNMDVCKVQSILQLSQETTSLDTIVDDESVTFLSELIKDEVTADPVEQLFTLTLQETLRNVIDQLSEREVTIITLRYGLNGEAPLTLEETGKLLGITRERVRQIQEKALLKLKELKPLSEYKQKAH
ncbi:MAG TPA: sigma-70 family RNA polymerase sigma factor [Spirochaetia bacterium]|nr:sigma-70 family RNA polymerase sigma factor [Spirochaetales bacterium]HRS66408.1 sigma-70 family RNA polymerase sigma factor [Spirochaetia bacterium]HRV27242.1 sigma-70 family RNA polymerase sigma factor [Spirochaetia bacterium]